MRMLCVNKFCQLVDGSESVVRESFDLPSTCGRVIEACGFGHRRQGILRTRQ